MRAYRQTIAKRMHPDLSIRDEITLSEDVFGRGERFVDALQQLHDRMAVRVEEIKQELRQLRGERL